jgi:hypothetical protein
MENVLTIYVSVILDGMDQPVKIEFVQTIAEDLIKVYVSMENAIVKKDLQEMIVPYYHVQMNVPIKENALTDYVFVIKDLVEQIVVKIHVQIIAHTMESAIKQLINVIVVLDLQGMIALIKNALMIVMDTVFVNLDFVIVALTLLEKVVNI